MAQKINVKKKEKNPENIESMEFDMVCEMFQPWSTFVMATSLPSPILEKMIKITDEILENKESTERAGEILVGQIDDEFVIAPNILKREGLIGFFLNMCRNYVIRASLQSQPFVKEELLKEVWLPKLTSMWIVSQKDHEYNPIHMHSDNISAIMYLKIPEYLPTRKTSLVAMSLQNRMTRNPPERDGSIVFTNNTSTDTIWPHPSLQIQPHVGDFFIFPASQQHFVYPFRTVDGKGERRSVSFNASFTSKSEQEFLKNIKKENK